MTDPDPTDPAYWDSAVANYEAQAAPFTGFFAEAALAMLDLRPGQRLLDVATGTGAAALAAARKGMSVTAIDFSHGMIERVRAHGLPNIVARQMDGQFVHPDFDAPGGVACAGGDQRQLQGRWRGVRTGLHGRGRTGAGGRSRESRRQPGPR